MEYIPDDKILQFHPKTLQYVRKTCNLDQPGTMDKAIDILESWVKKQQHFTKKDFSRDYLERTIVRAGGSADNAKKYLDNLCTTRTLLPRFFTSYDFGTPLLVDNRNIFLPTLTKDYYRVYFVQNHIQEYKPEMYDAFYKRLTYLLEYVCAHDYSSGLVWVYDFRNTNLIPFNKYLDKTEFGHSFNIVSNCYGFKIKGIYVMATSNLVDPIVAKIKEVVNKDLRDRIHVLKNEEDLYKYVDREILPKDYGGQEMSTSELYQKWVNILGSKEYNMYMADMNEAKVID